MFAEVDDLTVAYEEDGVEVVRELDKEILSRGAWATVIFRFRQWDPKTEDFGPDRFTIRRYKKVRGEYRQQAKFNISSRDQAEKIVAALQRWLAEPAAEGE